MLVGVVVLLVALGFITAPTSVNRRREHIESSHRGRTASRGPIGAAALRTPSAPSADRSSSPVATVVLSCSGPERHGQSTDTVFTVDATTGTISTVGALAAPVHDAVGTVVDGHDLVIGGRSTDTVKTGQSSRKPRSDPRLARRATWA